MRIILLVLTFGFVIASSYQVEAAVSKKTKLSKSKKTVAGKKKGAIASKTKKSNPTDAVLQTNVNFDDHGVTGEYQMPDEALARVENEKSLTDLLGPRKHFKDRLATASEQE